jgi:hypothetical protein
VNRNLKYSRWRRLPGLYRIGQKWMPGPEADLHRISLYLPGAVLDRAEALAAEAGVESVQAYCEALLTQAIEQAAAHRTLAEFEAEHGQLEGLDAIANDPEYLTEWTATTARETLPSDPQADAPAGDPPPPVAEAAAIVVRHFAGAGEPPPALLASLRRGEAIDPDAARELLDALTILERALRERPSIDRRLAFALHRLAFESQILISDAFPALGSDPATVETLRLVQEGVDRVLSGEDIRYESPDEAQRPG